MTVKDYKTHYKLFSDNIAFAARTWHHHVYLNNMACSDTEILAALNKAPRYWLDQRYIAVKTTIIFLGKIFDSTRRAYNVEKMLETAKNDKKHFSKPELRKRKIASSGAFDGIDDYVENATELNDEQYKALAGEVNKAKSIWKRIKPLRDNIYAHDGDIYDSNGQPPHERRKQLYTDIKNADTNDILQILLNVSNALQQMEDNGRAPDFSYDFTAPIDRAKKDIDELVDSLLGRQPPDNRLGMTV